jgi:opacity protein-like surface antigen
MSARRFRVSLVLVSLVLSSGSFAQDDGDDGQYAREGGYVGLGGVYVVENADTGDIEDDLESDLAAAGFPGTRVDLDVDDTWGLNARVGSRFGSRFAMELVGDWFDDADVDIDAVGPAGRVKTSEEVETWAVTYNLKGYLLTEERVQPYVVVGGGLLNVDDGFEDDYGFTWRLGGGYDFYQTENVVFNLEALYYLPTGNIRDFDFITVGLGVQYRF